MTKARTIYLDNNATTGADPRVIEEIVSNLKEGPLNPSAAHELGRKARSYLENGRQIIAKFLGVENKEIIFTSSGTEGLNLLIRGILKNCPQGHIISSNIEHSAIYNTLLDLKADHHEVELLSPSTYGALTSSQIEHAIKPQTRLVIVSWINGETGAKTDISSIARLCKERDIFLVVDGVALIGKELFSIPEGVSGMAFSAHKFHGPKGAGFIFLNKNISLHPQITGGHQEHNLRAGTEDLPNILGLVKAVSLIQKHLPQATHHMEELRDYFEKTLSEKIPLEINSEAPRICNVSNLYLKGLEAESLLFHLDRNGVMASHGSACSSLALEPSRILKNMGYSKERVLSSIRFSLSRNTTKDELDKCIEIILRHSSL